MISDDFESNYPGVNKIYVTYDNLFIHEEFSIDSYERTDIGDKECMEIGDILMLEAMQYVAGLYQLFGDTVNNLTLTATSLAPSTVTPGQNVEMLEVNFDYVGTQPTTLQELTIDLTGTAVDSDIAIAKLVNIFDDILGQGQFSNKKVTLSNLNYTLLPYTCGYLKVLFEISASAVSGHTAGVKIQSKDSIKLSDDIPIFGTFPLASNYSTIQTEPTSPQITTTTFPNGTVGQPYSQTLQATGGTPPYSWSITNGNLPNGLSLNESSGEISGTPTADGTFNFTAQVEDSEQQTDTQDLFITILPALNDNAELVKHINYPDGTRIIKGTSFTKIWRLRNTGTTDWNVGYALAFDGGDQMNAPKVLYLSQYVYPNETIDLSVPMKAPDSLGVYTGYFRMQTDDGQKFGERIHVQIEVVDAAIFVSGDITTDTTWNGSLYIVTGDVRVFDNATLTIVAGTQIRFRQNTSLTFGYDETIGHLDARGTVSLPISFVADLENPYPGYWQGIYFDANSTGVMDYCVILHAGSTKSNFRGSSWTTALLAWKAQLTLSHTQISESSTGLYLYQQSVATVSESMIDNNSGSGIALTHSDITMTNSTVSNNSGTGIAVGMDTSILSLSGNIIANNSPYGVSLYPSQTFTLAGNTLTNNNVLVYGGTITKDSVWAAVSVYHIYGDISVTDDATLTLAAGIQLHFNGYCDWNCYYYGLTFSDGTTTGNLIAKGTETNPIQFLALSSPYGWHGIYFDIGSTGTLEYCTLQKAGQYKSFHGGGYNTALMSWQATVSLAHTQITNSSGAGLLCS